MTVSGRFAITIDKDRTWCENQLFTFMTTVKRECWVTTQFSDAAAVEIGADRGESDIFRPVTEMLSDRYSSAARIAGSSLSRWIEPAPASKADNLDVAEIADARAGRRGARWMCADVGLRRGRSRAMILQE